MLIDTNIVVDLFRGKENTLQNLNTLPNIYLPVIALGELYIGTSRVSNKGKHLKELSDFLKSCTIVHINEETAKIYGSISTALYKKGKPIPTNDIWIAAIAIQNKFTLITGDKHFSEIAGLKIKSW